MNLEDLSDFNDSELSVLKTIRESETDTVRLTQRELSGRTGISLGMVNILLRRLEERGWVRVTRMTVKSVRYALTAAGMSELTRRTAGYFSRASRSVDRYRDRIDYFVLEAKRAGIGTIVLVGESEIESVVAYACERHGLVFVKSSDADKARQLARKSGFLLLYAESEAIPECGSDTRTEESLATVLASAGPAGLSEESAP